MEPDTGGERERVALGLRARPGKEAALARLLTRLRTDAGGLGGTVAAFTAPGRVVHIAETAPGAADADAPGGPAWAAVADGELRALCELPPDLPAAACLAGARLDRHAHYARPRAPGEPAHRRALLYPVRPGHGPALCRLLAAGAAPAMPEGLASALVSSTVYACGDTVVRFWEATASAADETDHITRIVPRSPLGPALNRLLDFDADLTTPDGFRAFFTSCAMTCQAPLSRPARRTP
jgi:hypothetical protein